MAIYRVRKPITAADLPPENAMDAEFQAADKAHIDATDPHSQYILGLDSVTDSRIVLFDNTSGKKIKSANSWVDSSGNGYFNGLAVARRFGNNCCVLLSNNTLPAPNTTGAHNTIIGTGGDFSPNTTGGFNVGIGIALMANTTGSQNTGIGVLCFNKNTTGSNNVGLGMYALESNTAGINNVGIGFLALAANTLGESNTAVGFGALNQSGLVNCSGLGNGASVSAPNQIQLGNSATTTFVFGTVQNRSDARDKVDIRSTVLGLDFIKALRPVDFRWDLRDSYRAAIPSPLLPDASEEEKIEYTSIVKNWEQKNKLAKIIRDGSKKRNRYHHGLIAQEVAAVIKLTGRDFGGYQDHTLSGGDEVLSLGYDEFIAPLIKAVQELATYTEALQARIVALESTKKYS